MTTVDTHPLHIAPAIEYYEEDAGLHNSPLMQPQRVSLLPSPSPPPNVPLPPASPESSPGPDGRKGSGRQKKYRPSQGDAVLVSFMGGGRYTDVARGAGDKPLASGDEDLESPVMEGTAVEIEGTKIELLVVEESEKDMENDETKEARIAENHAALAALAMNAMKKAQTSNEAAALKVITPNSSTSKQDAPPPPPAIEAMEGLKPPIHSLANLYVAASPDSNIKLERVTSPAGELPPIRQQSPQSAKSIGSGAHHITLPSITAQLGYINHLTEAPPAPESVFAQSPPGSRPLPRFSAVPGHGSPPKSPNDAFRRELPSPGRNQFYPYPSSHRRPSTAEGLPSFASAPEYSSSTADTPSTDNSGAIPATMGIDRMSIDGITNPQIGGFQCIYHGCTAQPFQTQYLLNSHANVHSSNRPHYCIVKGCPRSEGGKGFKRKNEMIRHGLVHDSPGYVCPFCPDREHKYPRPDNLQRHVRVHHVDKDKDDPQLREVLSQRPEGPSRGRRRRGGTS